jgi:hypothetical protein
MLLPAGRASELALDGRNAQTGASGPPNGGTYPPGT